MPMHVKLIILYLLRRIIIYWGFPYPPPPPNLNNLPTLIFTKHSYLFRKLVIGGDEITPDSSKEGESSSEYQFSWITNGFQPTKSGKRSELSFSFKFENAQVLNKLQVKFYPQEKGSHLTWGTEIHRIEYEVRGIERISKGSEATPYKTLAPHNINFR